MVKRRVGAWVRSLMVAVIGTLGSALLTPVTQAQIFPDPTLNTQTFGVCGGSGGACGITNGTIRGSNLFHSFQQFSLPNGDFAAFIINNPAIQNVLVRVTGNTLSNINGTIATTDPTGTTVVPTNFFLLNPNGIVFGPGATLLNGGSFLATTAERMLFQDGTVFDTRDTTVNSLLTVSVPTGLQMGHTPGAIQMRETLLRAGINSLFTGLTLVGRDVSLENAAIFTPGRRVELGAVAGGGNVELDASGRLNVPDGVPRGDVSFSNNSLVNVQLQSGSDGDIGITANNISVLSGSVLAAGILPGLGTATSQAGDITLNATGQVQVNSAGQATGIGNVVSANATGSGGNLRITANSLEVLNGAQLSTSTFGSGDAGNVVISARDRILFSGTNTSALSRVEATGVGNGGNVQIDTVVHQVMVGYVTRSCHIQRLCVNPARCAAVVLNRLCTQIQLK